MTRIPGAPLYPQIESLDYRSPVSENAVQNMGAAITYLLDTVQPIGTIVYSFLNESQFLSQIPNPANWVLADGRSITGSALAALKGVTNAPDLTGVFIRGRNYGRSTLTGNTAGDLAEGSFETDKLSRHEHFTAPAYDNTDFGQLASGRAPGAEVGLRTNQTLLPPGPDGTGISTTIGTEVAPRAVTMNAFIRVN